MSCEIEVDGQVVEATGWIGPGVVYTYDDPDGCGDHPLQSWCTSPHIAGKGDLLAPAAIPAHFRPCLGNPCRPFLVPKR
jgi:hypothetical protein